MKRYKKDFTYSYTLGVFPTLELLSTRPGDVVKVFFSSKGDRNTGLDRIKVICDQQHIPLEISDYLIAKLTDAENTYAIGVFNKYDSTLTTDSNHLVLVNPSDRGNLGTIIRTMTAFGITNLALISPAVDIFDPKVIRASMGAVFHINFTYFPSFSDYRSMFPRTIYSFMTQAEISLPEAKFTPPFALVFGNESSGLSEEYRQFGPTVSIPQKPQVDSLNLSTAVAVGLYSASLHN